MASEAIKIATKCIVHIDIRIIVIEVNKLNFEVKSDLGGIVGDQLCTCKYTVYSRNSREDLLLFICRIWGSVFPTRYVLQIAELILRAGSSSHPFANGW